MRQTAVVFSSRYLLHNPGAGHPESHRRLKVIMEGIDQDTILKKENCSLIEPRYASPKDLELVHSPKYINFVRQLSESGGGLLGEYTTASQESFDVARLAAGGVMEAVDKVMAGEFQNAFALVRPPGHHAGPACAFGFCIFNNVALAAKHLLKHFGLDRVLVLDIDAHHGNGTQQIFYDVDEVLYISIHEDPSEFPQTGYMTENGKGEGLGYTVNIPLPFKTGDYAYWKAVKTIATPIIRQYRPQFILVSAGFDGYYRDSVGELSLSAYIYPRVFETILDLAHHFSEDRVIAVLEGGYRLAFLKKIVPAIIAHMGGLNARVRDRRPFLDPNIQIRAEKTVQNVRRIQSCFWAM